MIFLNAANHESFFYTKDCLWSIGFKSIYAGRKIVPLKEFAAGYMKFEAVTIKDIAKALGISTSTVSRALKDHPAINKNTKKEDTGNSKRAWLQA